MLVSEESAMGLLRSKLLPDALLGTSVDEAAGIRGPLGKWFFPYLTTHPEATSGHDFCLCDPARTVLRRAGAQAFPGETAENWTKTTTNAQMCPDAVLGVEMPQPQAKRKDTDRPNCTRANNC